VLRLLFGRGRDAVIRPRSSLDLHRPRTLSRPKRIVFALLTLLLAWGLLELGGFFLIWLALGESFSWSELQLRRDRRVAQFESRNAFDMAQIHPYVGYVEDPRPANAVQALADRRVVPVSEYGYIDNRLPFQARAPGRVVIGIAGGSVACFFAVNGTRRLEAELAKDSRFAGKQLVFVNMAVRGYKQPQQLMTLAYLLSMGAEFDLILNIDGFNEVALDSLENGPGSLFPAFPRDWRARIAGGDTNLGLARSKLFLLGAERADRARAFSRSPWRYSFTCSLAWELLDRRLDYQMTHVLDSFQRLGRERSPYVVTGPRREFSTIEDRFDFLIEIWANCSVLMNRLCRSGGIRYYHFLQPNQYVSGSKPMGDAEKRIAILEGHPYSKGVRMGYPLLSRKGESLKTLGVSYHDLTKIFAGHPETIYVDTCCHYNQAGYEIMADAIARAILNDPATRAE